MRLKLLTLCMALCCLCLHATSQNVPDYVPSDGLVAWYPFNGNANDESGNGNDGVANGAVLSTDRWGLTNRSYSFSGSGDYVVAPRLYQNGFSVSLWFKTESVQSYNPLIDAFDSNWEIQLKNSHPDYVSFNDEGGYIEHLASETVQNNVWYNLICTFSDETVSFYTDGTLTDQFSVFVLPNNSGDYFIGASPSGIPQFFIGEIDDIGIWDRALTEEEILALYNAPAPTPGCTDSLACNFNAEANNEDGSCVYPLFGEDCETGAAACGEGTVWDASIQACVCFNDCPADLNGNGLVEVSDLLMVLADFGTECPPEVAEWTCGDPVNYQGFDYATVQIGDQCWFAENLRTEHYNNGDAIPANLSNSEWGSTTEGAVAVYGEDAGCQNYSPDGDACDPVWSLDEYGRLYNWYAVDDDRSLCPTGWHVPTDGEWTVLTNFLGGESVAGVEMKSTFGWFDENNGNNSSGFSGLPGGHRQMSGSFNNAGYTAGWWSTSPNDSALWYRYLTSEYSDLYRYSGDQVIGLSVRCLKDSE